MKLWKVRIKTYIFGTRYNHLFLFVYADTEENMIKVVKLQLSTYRSYVEDAEMVSYEQIDLADETNRVL